MMSLMSPEHSPRVVLRKGKFDNGCSAREQVVKTNIDCCSSGSSISDDQPETQPFSRSYNALDTQRIPIPASPPSPFSASPAFERQIDSSLAVGHEGTRLSHHECGDHISTSTSPPDVPERPLLPPRLDIPYIPPPVLPKFVLPPLSPISNLRPLAIKELFERGSTSSVPRYDDGDILMSSIPPSSQRNSPPAGVKRDLHSIGNVFTCILEFPLLTIREPQWEMRHAG